MQASLTISSTITEWFVAYRENENPNAAHGTLTGYRQASNMLAFAFDREATAADLTTARLALAERKWKDAGYSKWVINRTLRVLMALWRFVGRCGEALEVAPRNRHWQGKPQGRLKGFKVAHVFEALTGFLPQAPTELPVSQQVYDIPELRLPTITGPTAGEIEDSRGYVAAHSTARREQLRRLLGTSLFTWSGLYQEWACIADGASRNAWRFALVRFAAFLQRPPELDDLTTANQAGVLAWLTASGVSSESARQVIGKLKCVWRFAWECGALETKPAIDRMRLSGKRFGRPSIAKCP